MGSLTEVPQFSTTVPKFEVDTVLLGGADAAPMNAPLKALADRTQWLKQEIEAIPPPGVPAVFTHSQPSAASTWTINHNFGRTPLTQVFSVGGVELVADVVSVTVNQTQVRFASPTAGYAQLI